MMNPRMRYGQNNAAMGRRGCGCGNGLHTGWDTPWNGSGLGQCGCESGCNQNDRGGCKQNDHDRCNQNDRGGCNRDRSVARNRGCGCNGQERTGCTDKTHGRLLRELQKVDFSLIDLILYLDMYPDCEESKQLYHSLQEQRKQLLCQLSHEGYPMSNQLVSGDFSDWTKGPWPWELDANA